MRWRREDFARVGISLWRQNDLEASHGCLFQFTRASYHSVRVQDLVSRAALPYATISAISDATVLGDSRLSDQLRHRPPPRLSSAPPRPPPQKTASSSWQTAPSLLRHTDA